MRKRSTEILQRLIDAPTHALGLSALLSDYHISDMTLRSDLQAMNSFVKLPDGSPVAYLAGVHVGLSLGADPSSVQEFIDGMDLYDYQLALPERKLYVVARLIAAAGSPVSMQRLADDMHVTRNTVVNDSKVIGEYLAGLGASLIARGKHGMSLETGDDIRCNILLSVFSEILEGRHHSHDYFSRVICGVLGFEYGLDDIVGPMRRHLKANNTVVSHDAESEIAACLVVMLNERGGRPTDSLPAVVCEDDCSFDLIDSLILGVAAGLPTPVRLGVADLASIKATILSRDLLPQVKNIDDFELYSAISHFLYLTGLNLGIELQNDDLLVGALLSHVKSVVDWNSDAFEFNVSDPSGFMVDSVRRAAEPHYAVLELYLNHTMDEAMRTSIAIHICAALYRQESVLRPANVIVTCPASAATSRYLEAQIKNYFRVNIVASAPVAELSKLDVVALDADFVVSTVPLETSPLPVAVVAPVLTIDDLNKIQALLFDKRAPGRHPMGEISPLELLGSAYEAASPEKRASLDRSIESLLRKLADVEERARNRSKLHQMLHAEYVVLSDESLSWREAIRESARRLGDDGYFVPTYVDKAIENVESYGNYIVVSEGVALAHAGHQDGALKDGLGLLVSREGIAFDEDTIVHLLFFFSQKSDANYLDLFHEIIRLGGDQDGIRRIREASRAEDVIRLLGEILTDYSLVE